MLKVKPKISAELDSGFLPPALFLREYRKVLEKSYSNLKLSIGLEDSGGRLHHYNTLVLSENDSDSLFHIDRLVKFLLWSVGGHRVHLTGSEKIAEFLRRQYSSTGSQRFDAAVMEKVFIKPFEIAFSEDEIVPSRKTDLSIGGNFEGYRVGFDLGASDYKIAAIDNGKTVFTEETPWNPKDESDPAYHYNYLNAGLKRAASHLPRVDAIGGSSAGIFMNNRIRIASIFRSVPEDVFKAKVEGFFLSLQEEWGVPLRIINDGDVTALAAHLSLGKSAVLGIAMGSSEASGYIDATGNISGFLNELAFAPVDYNQEAPVDEWSGGKGVGAQYFSQQAVNRLAIKAGVAFSENDPLPSRLEKVQQLMKTGDGRAKKVFETIGIYLGYTIPHYLEHYNFQNLLIIGRVTSGEGGEIIREKAKEVLRTEFPNLHDSIEVHLPDEKSKRVGQAVAAASLPEITK